MKTNKFLAALLIGSSLLANTAYAAGTPVSGNVTANLHFDAPLTLTTIDNIDFGLLKAGTAASYTISTAGSVTTPDGSILGGAPKAGKVTIAGSSATNQVINISTANPTAAGGVSLSNTTCSYDGGAAGPCTLANQAAPGAGKTLLLGVTALVDGNQLPGTTASPSFEVVVNYN